MTRLWPSLVLLLSLAGCGVTTRQTPVEIFPDMDRQPKYKPQAASSFFSDGRSSRSPVPGTVAAGQLRADDAYETGIASGMFAGGNPFPIDAAVLARGRERFDIYCAPCHDRTGSGKGIVPVRSSWIATNLHEERIRGMGDGELYNVASYGRRTMPGYRFQVPASDRWAIVAYVRALQRARAGTLADVPPELRPQVR
ncbi:MAG TPA: cytochrome c [Bryobacteraceae bacterium]|nr:cytochrome c [Bryobacteraceae bacterium]